MARLWESNTMYEPWLNHALKKTKVYWDNWIIFDIQYILDIMSMLLAPWCDNDIMVIKANDLIFRGYFWNMYGVSAENKL